MKKKIEIFGKKVPFIAILVVALIISTASAAVYQHYATMMGDVAINSPVHVIIDGNPIPLGGTYELTIEDIMSPCTISETFQFNNTYGSPIEVSVLWILYEKDAPFPLNASTSYWVYDTETVMVSTGISADYTVNLDVPAYMMGDHTFRIDVNPVY